MQAENQPTILVILGITGDLANKKIIPALYNLFIKDELTQHFAVIGFGRRELSPADFKNLVSQSVINRIKTYDQEKLKHFVGLFSYQQGLFDDPKSYQILGDRLNQIQSPWEGKTNRLFYLSVPPELYELIFKHLKSSNLSSGSSTNAQTRILVEKPFGKNLESAERLDELLGSLFTEEKIYRIDHYLAKEMVQNIIAFRFLNDLFESTWNNKFIEQIEIRLWETLGVESRGAFYDGVGALRDVGQNHLLQMLALIAMEEPSDINSTSIHTKRSQLLNQLKILSQPEIAAKTFRAKYQGYDQIAGVALDSTTETYFRMQAEINNPRWKGVPIIMEGGKRMLNQRKEIIVTYKHDSDCFCPPGRHLRNQIIFEIEPEEAIKIQFWSKAPGLKWQIADRTMEFLLRTERGGVQYVEEYEKLLLDAILGDQTLFVSTSEVRAMWRFIDPIVAAWQNQAVPLSLYEPDTEQAVIDARNKF